MNLQETIERIDALELELDDVNVKLGQALVSGKNGVKEKQRATDLRVEIDALTAVLPSLEATKAAADFAEAEAAVGTAIGGLEDIGRESRKNLRRVVALVEQIEGIRQAQRALGDEAANVQAAGNHAAAIVNAKRPPNDRITLHKPLVLCPPRLSLGGSVEHRLSAAAGVGDGEIDFKKLAENPKVVGD
jgi:hypothetical protein